MKTVLVSALILIGALFSLVAALGILRMPDLLMRMHAATKAGTLGAGLVLLAAAVALGEPGAVLRAGAAIVFLLLTAPVAAHLIGRSAYHSGHLRLWEGTRVDELRDAHAALPAPGHAASVPKVSVRGAPQTAIADTVVEPMNTQPATRSEPC